MKALKKNNPQKKSKMKVNSKSTVMTLKIADSTYHFQKPLNCSQGQKMTEEDDEQIKQEKGQKAFEQGWFYYCGIGVQQSLPKAFKHFRQAAEQGYALAQCWMEALVQQNMKQEQKIIH